MTEQALTTSGSRTFAGGVAIHWTPATTGNSVLVTISVGGTTVWYRNFEGDSAMPVNVSGDNYTMSGTISVRFGAEGTTGELEAEDWAWKVGNSPHAYNGVIGFW
jgi:hypothetical protein